MTATQPGTAVTSHRIDLIDEDDAGRVRLALLEEVAYPARPHTHEHLHEIGAGHGEEGPAGLPRHGLGQQRLASARRSDQQGPLGKPTAEPGELLGILQELDDFLELDFGLVGAGNVRERDLRSIAREQLGLGFTEREGPAAAGLELAQEEEPESQNDDPG